MRRAMFLTPVVTAFDSQGNIDVQGNKNIWEHLIKNDIDGIVLLGSTGEFFSLSIDEKKFLIDQAVEYVNKRVKLYVGTGSMTIEETVELSNYALEKGVDAVMVIGPYYFSLSSESIESYFDEVAKKVKGDIFLYNFPERTGYDLNAEITLNLLRKNKNIIGFKDTVNEMGHTRKLITTVREEFPNFIILAGYDENLAHIMLSDGDGCIGGLSNLYPEIFSRWVKSINENNIDDIYKYQKIVNEMMELYTIGTPFIPIVKKAMLLRGIEIENHSIKPFLNATDNQTEKIKNIINYVDSFLKTEK